MQTTWTKCTTSAPLALSVTIGPGAAVDVLEHVSVSPPAEPGFHLQRVRVRTQHSYSTCWICNNDEHMHPQRCLMQILNRPYRIPPVRWSTYANTIHSLWPYRHGGSVSHNPGGAARRLVRRPLCPVTVDTPQLGDWCPVTADTPQRGFVALLWYWGEQEEHKL